MSVQRSISWPSKLLAMFMALLLMIGVVAGAAWFSLSRPAPLTVFESPEEHFKYGSIGTEAKIGLPFWVWVVLPRLFPEKLPGPGGYTSLGLAWEPGREMPVGFTKETIGVPRVGLNCAACHVGTVRSSLADAPSFLAGAPNAGFDIQRYLSFLFDSARDPRFNANFILPEITYNIPLSPWERLMYRFLLIPRSRRALLAAAEDPTWTNSRPELGPGRTDMNPLKIGVARLQDDGSVGSTDAMAIWNESRHEGLLKHSDGLTPSLHESVLSSALGTGATLASLNEPNLQRVEEWMEEVPPAPYPFAIDASASGRGSALFQQHCASCHAFGGERTGTVIPVAEIGTDAHRADHWTPEAAEAMNSVPTRVKAVFSSFQDTDGYVAHPLDGLWARAPYLHNGSVPDLAAMLSPPEERPATFRRGFNLYDPERVGFDSSGVEATRIGWLHDTGNAGNGNQGHSFGVDMTTAQKDDLLEYLKTL